MIYICIYTVDHAFAGQECNVSLIIVEEMRLHEVKHWEMRSLQMCEYVSPKEDVSRRTHFRWKRNLCKTGRIFGFLQKGWMWARVICAQTLSSVGVIAIGRNLHGAWPDRCFVWSAVICISEKNYNLRQWGANGVRNECTQLSSALF